MSDAATGDLHLIRWDARRVIATIVHHMSRASLVTLLVAICAFAVTTPAQAQATRFPCPVGTTGYSGELQPWSCVTVFRDRSGHEVLVRSGRSGAAGFGLVHALLDHNVEEQIIGDVISAAPAGESQGGTRFQYKYYTLSTGPMTVIVREDRGPSTVPPDRAPHGMLTAYCLGPTHCPAEINDMV